MDIIPDNAYVMIIAFSSTASVLHSFVKITSNSTRTKLAQKVPSTAYGSTCIGCGIKLALDNLEVSILYIFSIYNTCTHLLNNEQYSYVMYTCFNMLTDFVFKYFLFRDRYLSFKHLIDRGGCHA